MNKIYISLNWYPWYSIFISNGHPLSFKKHIIGLLSPVWGSDSVAFVWTMSFVTILRSIQILIYKVINYTDGITVHILIFRRLKVVRYPYHSMDSVMDMRISLKASQYMMLSRTKVQGKTILDTRSWNKYDQLSADNELMTMLTMQIARSLLLFMISFVSTPPPSLALPPCAENIIFHAWKE